MTPHLIAMEWKPGDTVLPGLEKRPDARVRAYVDLMRELVPVIYHWQTKQQAAGTSVATLLTHAASIGANVASMIASREVAPEDMPRAIDCIAHLMAQCLAALREGVILEASKPEGSA